MSAGDKNILFADNFLLDEGPPVAAAFGDNFETGLGGGKSGLSGRSGKRDGWASDDDESEEAEEAAGTSEEAGVDTAEADIEAADSQSDDSYAEAEDDSAEDTNPGDYSNAYEGSWESMKSAFFYGSSEEFQDYDLLLEELSTVAHPAKVYGSAQPRSKSASTVDNSVYHIFGINPSRGRLLPKRKK